MADWLAPRIRESPLWKMAMSDHDPELIAIMLERMIPEYFESIEFPATIIREGTLVYMEMKGDDDDSEPINVSVPFLRGHHGEAGDPTGILNVTCRLP